WRCVLFFFQAEDGIRDRTVTGVQTCALPILLFFSAATSATVCSSRSCSAAGSADITVAASASLVDAWYSPSAAMTRARRSRSARSEERRVGKGGRRRWSRDAARRRVVIGQRV